MTDPNTQTPPTDPQDLIDQALSGTTPPPTPETATDPAATATPTITEPAPLPTPEPLTPSEPTKTPESAPEPTPEPTPEPAVMPSELVKPEESVAEAPQAMPSTEPAISTKASDESKPEEMIQPPIKMGEDVPLAFAPNAPTVEPVVATEAAAPPAEAPPANVPPAIVGNMTSAEPTPTQKPKKKGMKLVGIIVGLFAALGALSYVGYQYYGYFIEPGQISVVCDSSVKWCRDPNTGVVSQNDNWVKGDPNNYNPVDDSPNANVRPSEATKESCNGCSNGGWLVWRNGECKVTGVCDSNVPGKNTENPNIEEANTATSCNKVGGFWCKVTDASGKNHEFCGSNSGDACYQQAIAKGITMQVGILQCIDPDKDGNFMPDPAVYGNPPNDLKVSKEVFGQVVGACGQTYSTMAKESYICKEGVEGEGNVVYSGGPCTALNGKKFTGNLGCFCGTVQVDTPNGHTSYSSTCGCDNETPEPSTPTLTSDPTLMCKSLTRTPTTAPKIGDRLTFTCAGASTPAGAVNLTYKFRYSLNSGAYIALNNATPTTAELMIASCGNYKVQCQACGTIKGTLTCDPTWSAATQ